MKNYAVFLQGNDFSLTRDDIKDVLGFFITVRVEAESEEKASILATEIVKSEPELAEAFSTNASTKPSIEVKVVHELLPENKMNKTEFFFYSMEEE